MYDCINRILQQIGIGVCGADLSKTNKQLLRKRRLYISLHIFKTRLRVDLHPCLRGGPPRPRRGFGFLLGPNPRVTSVCHNSAPSPIICIWTKISSKFHIRMAAALITAGSPTDGGRRSGPPNNGTFYSTARNQR
ncbi:hypothetical protein EVAR_63751_1 [Eumeta japonica]|uniref:Uncharacterized protein n=1 Tax=Eumeta variegata TaxID=151549 RepID=A0A4C1ZRZ5_EUMVA|nr:hypothetical protein EVAR_63751_1 [Eumeta japonica]